jgi:hypothetical protein
VILETAVGRTSAVAMAWWRWSIRKRSRMRNRPLSRGGCCCRKRGLGDDLGAAEVAQAHRTGALMGHLTEEAVIELDPIAASGREPDTIIGHSIIGQVTRRSIQRVA